MTASTVTEPGDQAAVGERPDPRPDLRLIPPALAAWLTALAVLGSSAGVATRVAVLAGVTAAGLLFVVRRRWANVLAAALVCAAAAAASVGIRLAAVGQGPLRALADDRAATVLDLVVTADPVAPPPRAHGSVLRRSILVRARAEVAQVKGERVGIRSPVLVIASEQGWASLLPSQRVRAHGHLVRARHGELLTAVLLARGPPRPLEGPSALQRAAGRVRAGLRAAAAPLPREERGLLPGLVVGDTSLMDPLLAEDFRTTGLSHLLAVSGSNVAIVLAAVLGAARWIGFGARTAPLLAGLGVLGFAVLARPSPSVLRATVMGMVAVVAMVSGRPRQGLPALCAAVLGLVLFDPELARSYGFALSVLATAGLLVLAPGWRDRIGRRTPRFLAEAIAVPVAAQVVCAPVIAMLSGQVSMAAVPVNLLAAPAVAPATVLGVLAAVAAPVWLPLAQVFARLGGLAVSWLVILAHTGAGLPYATLPWPAGTTGAVALVGALIIAAVLLARTRLRRVTIACVAGVVLAAFALRALAPGWPPPGWLLVACDVGQGDALVLAAGHGAAVVVDTGPDQRLVDGCLRDLHVRRVPLLVLTHLHADHVEGVPGALRHREVGAVAVGPWPEPRTEAVRVDRWLRAAGVPVRHPVAGTRWTIGTLRLTVLAPRGSGWARGAGRPPGDTDSSAENNASLVLKATWAGTTALLTGDIEPEAQRPLLSHADVRADVLKVPHHGSAHQDPRFLAAVGARLALISVGADNDYGHPAASTLGLLRSLGARPYRTDRDGDVTVVRTGHGLAVVARHEGRAGRDRPG